MQIQQNAIPSSECIKQEAREYEQKVYDHRSLIQETRKLVAKMSTRQRYSKAKKHLMDAIRYQSPRPETWDQNIPRIFKIIYSIQTSYIWSVFLYLLSYLFMYLVMLNYDDQYRLKIGLQWGILGVLWIDVAMEVYHKSYQTLRTTSKYQPRFYIRVAILLILLVEEIVFVAVFTGGRPIRPFKLIRGLLPIFYDHFVRKSCEALLGSWKDIIVYLLFYTIVILTFSLVANQIIQIPPETPFDKYRQNYVEYGSCIYVMYVLGSYDSYPDNQLIAINASLWNYALFIIFILLNIFFFTVIPATIIFQSFRDTRSKIHLVDQIKQQHSLILCFVSLGEQDYNITVNSLIKFLLYVYKDKVRYVDYITHVCLELDNNNNKTIQVNEFMQLCRVLQSNSAMMPPMLQDWKNWIRLRDWINEHTHLNDFIQKRPFNAAEVLFIILAFINGIMVIVFNLQPFIILDTVLTAIFMLFLIVRIIGTGPQQFFDANANTVDFILVLLAVIFECIDRNSIARNSDVLIKMVRIYRISVLIDMTSLSGNSIYKRLRQLFGQMAIILPIILKFFPMILIVYYILGIIGMESFYGNSAPDAIPSPYSAYNQFSNFDWFLGTQFIMIQVLTEAGWSMVAFEQAYKHPNLYGIIFFYFVACHLITVLIFASLIKGLVWEIYSTVHEEYSARRIKFQTKTKYEEAVKKRKEQIQQIRKQMEDQYSKNAGLVPNTVLKKELYQNKLDLEILHKLRKIYSRVHPNKMSNRSMINSQHTLENQKILLKQIKFQQTGEPFGLKRMLTVEQENQNSLMKLDQFEDNMQHVIGSMMIRPKTMFSEVILYPRAFVTYLQQKLIVPINSSQHQIRFDLDQNAIRNKASLNLLTSKLNSLLDIEKSQKQQRSEIIKHMVLQGYINERQAKRLLLEQTHYDASQSIDINGIVRSTFLGGTNDELIRKFEIQYFSDIYGKSFKQINKLTLQPLLRYEATLTYCFRNLLRYPNVDQMEFFTLLNTIEDKISNKILKKGSLFKFVYQLDTLSDTWFSVELKETKDLKIHFIKSGIWVYTPNMKKQTVYYGQDIFNWNIKDLQNKQTCEGYMRRFYQAFESLAFCLLDEHKFFSGNPTNFIYDLYTYFTEVREMPRSYQKVAEQLRISKIMMVVLSKEDKREQKDTLQYDLTELVIEEPEGQERNLDGFRYDESDDKTFQKLKKLSVMDYEKIVQSEGLPYAFILNLMNEISETLSINPKNLVEHIQKALNKEFYLENLQRKQVIEI